MISILCFSIWFYANPKSAIRTIINGSVSAVNKFSNNNVGLESIEINDIDMNGKKAYKVNIINVNGSNFHINNIAFAITKNPITFLKQDKTIDISSIIIKLSPSQDSNITSIIKGFNASIVAIFGGLLDILENIPSKITLNIAKIDILSNQDVLTPSGTMSSTFIINDIYNDKEDIVLKFYNIETVNYDFANKELMLSCKRRILKFNCNSSFLINAKDGFLKNTLINIDLDYKKNNNTYFVNYDIKAQEVVVKENTVAKNTILNDVKITGDINGFTAVTKIPQSQGQNFPLYLQVKATLNNFFQQGNSLIFIDNCANCINLDFTVSYNPEGQTQLNLEDIIGVTKLFNLGTVTSIGDAVSAIVKKAVFTSNNLIFNINLSPPDGKKYLDDLEIKFNIANAFGNVETGIANFSLNNVSLESTSDLNQTKLIFKEGTIAKMPIITNSANKEQSLIIEHQNSDLHLQLSLGGSFDNLIKVFDIKDCFSLRHINENKIKALDINLFIPLKSKDIFNDLSLDVKIDTNEIFKTIFFNSNTFNANIIKQSNSKQISIDAELNNVSSNQSDHLNLLKDIIMPKVYLKSLVNITDKDIGSVSILATKTKDLQSSGESKIVFLELIFKDKILENLKLHLNTKSNNAMLDFNANHSLITLKATKLELASLVNDIPIILNQNTDQEHKEIDMSKFKIPNLDVIIDSLALYNGNIDSVALKVNVSDARMVMSDGDFTKSNADTDDSIEYSITRNVDKFDLKSGLVKINYNSKEFIDKEYNLQIDIPNIQKLAAGLGLVNIKNGKLNGFGRVIKSSKTNRSYLDVNTEIENLSFKAGENDLTDMRGEVNVSIPLFANDNIVNIDKISLTNAFHSIFVKGNINMHNLDIKADLKYTPAIVKKASNVAIIGLAVQGLSLFRQEGPIGLSYRIDGKLYSPRINLGSVSFLMFKLGRGNIAKNEKR